MYKCIKYILAIVVLLSLSLRLQAESKRFGAIVANSRIPYTDVNNVIEDSYGFLWISTWSGVLKFDGNSYTKYWRIRNNDNSLSSNVCFKSFEDSRGRLWVCTGEGLCLYDRVHNNFERVRFKTQNSRGAYAMTEDKDGYLWVVGSEALIRFSPERKDTAYFKGNWGMDLVDLDDEIWVCSVDIGVNIFSKKDGSFMPLKTKGAEKVSSRVKTILKASDGTVFLGSVDKGFYHLTKEREVLGHYPANGATYGICSNSILSFFEDSKHNVWIGSVNGNLALFNLKKRRYEPLTYQLPENVDPNNVTVSSILQDSHDNFWLSTHRFWMLNSNSVMDAFYYYQKGSADEGSESLSNNVVSSLALLQNSGKVIIGTDGGGLTFFSNEKGFLGHDFNIGNVVLDIEVESDSVVWYSTWGDGLVKYNLKTNKLQRFRNDPEDVFTIPSNFINGIHVEDSIVWVATDGCGLARLDRRTGKFKSWNNSDEFPFNATTPHFVTHVLRDSKQRLWISSSAGLACYTNHGEYKLYTYSNKEGSISQNEIVMCYEDKKGRIWVVSETGGLDLFDEQRRCFVSYSEKMGIPNDLRSIAEDMNGNLWIGAIDAVYLFNPDEDVLKQYDLSFDLKGSTLSKRAVLTDGNNNLFFGTSNGFFRVNPKDIKPIKSNPYVYLKGFYLWDKKQEVGTSDILKEDIAFAKSVVLNYEQNFFSLEFTSVNLDVHESLKYFYKLEGFHPNWLPADHSQRVSFSNLNPGTYKFHVRACTQEGICNETEHPLTIVILPPWWGTWWFKVLVVLALALAVFAFVKVRLRILNKQKEELERQVKSRTEELSQKTLEIQMQKESLEKKNRNLDEALSIKNKIMSVIAHDLKNPLTVVVGMLSFLQEDKSVSASETLSSQMNTITKAAKKLQDQMENLLQWSRLQNKNIFYSPENVFLDTVVKDCASLLHESATEKGITVNCASHTQRAAFVDGRMIATVVRNLLNNAIKYTPKRGRIDIDVTESDNFIEIEVKDNGVGISKEQMSKLFDHKYNISTNGTENEKGSGLGLNICHDFVLTNKGEIEVVSPEEGGTRVVVRLPKGEAVKREKTSVVMMEQPAQTDNMELASKKTLLLVDDNPDVQSLLALLFQNYFEIEMASDGEEGLEKALQILPDLVISDVVMPKMDGKQMCTAIKSNPISQHIPVIMLTSEDSDDSQVEGLSLGADDYLTKPFNNEVLVAKVNTILQNKERQRSFLRSQILDMPADKMPESRDDAFLRKVIEVLQNNISEPELSVEFLAEKTALSRVQLFRKFKAITGCSPSEYIKMFRLQYAATMLASGKYSVADVAYQVGYSDPKYFSSCFAEKYGMSPSQYAKSKRQE